ncbi:hypothetical protein M885DRAFT_626071 [Pelagophyceae sp. CCMP2097]|nr:hypothetical protein M885DRAFT_626071 [Pelagophyceae sp. CCMP2097]
MRTSSTAPPARANFNLSTCADGASAALLDKDAVRWATAQLPQDWDPRKPRPTSAPAGVDRSQIRCKADAAAARPTAGPVCRPKALRDSRVRWNVSSEVPPKAFEVRRAHTGVATDSKFARCCVASNLVEGAGRVNHIFDQTRPTRPDVAPTRAHRFLVTPVTR